MNNNLPGAFYFQLSLSGVSTNEDAAFKEVSGISTEMGAEEIAEGGNNIFKHRVPTSVKFSNLVLKSGLVPRDSELINWCNNTLGGNLDDSIETKNIIVKLLDENGNPIKSWSFVNAWPVKWVISDLKSGRDELVIESMEFAYSYFNALT